MEPSINTNDRSTSIGTLCWHFREHSLTFANLAVGAFGRRDLADYRKLFESAKKELPLTVVELPAGVVPFGERFLADIEEASELLPKYLDGTPPFPQQ